MKSNKKNFIVAIAVVLAVAIGCMFFFKTKKADLNEQTSTPEEMIKKIKDLDVDTSGLSEVVPIDSNRLPDMMFDDNGNPVSSPKSE